MKRRVMGTMVVISSLFGFSADAAEAQRSRGPGGFVGVSFVAADAVGDLGTVVNEGFGLALSGGAAVAGGGHLRLRADLGFVIYGLEQIQYCSFGCRVASELTTTNSILWGGVGPEIVLARGPVQPYVHASAGLSYFVTSSSLDDRDGYGPYLEHHDNGVTSYLTEGDIVDEADGSVTLYPNRSDADLLSFHLGISVGMR